MAECFSAARLDPSRTRVLKGNSLFSAFTDRELDQLAEFLEPVRLTAGETLFLKGDPGDKLYIVVDGLMRVSLAAADGREVIINLLKPGQIFGEIATLDGSERSADMTAETNTELLALDRVHLMSFLARSPEACLRMLSTVCARLRWVNELFEDACFMDFRSRLAKRLLMLGQLFGEDASGGGTRIRLKLSQKDLAAHVGVTRESVNKVLKEWEGQGLMRVDGGWTVLLDIGELASLAERKIAI